MSRSSTTSSGLSLGSVLTVVFVVLKLTHNIDWSWWWVLSPLWIGACLIVAVLLVILLVAALAAIAGSR